MTIEISSAIISPRISFSHDLNQPESESDYTTRRVDSSLLDTSSDFHFRIGNNLLEEQEHHYSSADELFSDGMILPLQIKKSPTTHVTTKPTEKNTEKKRLKEFLCLDPDDDDEDNQEEKPPSKFFWQFKRSSSLNCESTRTKRLIRPTLNFLSRSNSTGSAPNPKPTVLSKSPQTSTKQQHLQKQTSKKSSNFSYHYATQRSPSRKGSYNSSGIRVSPILNFPSTPFVSNSTANFFGFGSLFCNSSSSKRKKKKR